MMKLAEFISELQAFEYTFGNIDVGVAVWTTNDEDFGDPDITVEQNVLVIRGDL
ncbi:hypothetical protein [Mycobacterium sp. Root265]|uniref:hypothetical protein n=1 Tax=Mycobacterium sp. Root265 TaxID=1736504 RepID=UPI000AFC944A|nr:hypothetical protein [Mycobacterium sp. Root265]